MKHIMLGYVLYSSCFVLFVLFGIIQAIINISCLKSIGGSVEYVDIGGINNDRGKDECSAIALRCSGGVAG